MRKLPVPYSLPETKWVHYLLQSFKVCCFVLLILVSIRSAAQTFPSPSSCTSGDLLLVNATLPSTPCETCGSGATVTKSLTLYINNKTGSTRTSFAFWATLVIRNADGSVASSTPINKCFATIPSSAITPFSYGNLSYTCGQSLELTNIWEAWTDASPKSTCPTLIPPNISPKCGRVTSLNVVAGVDATFDVTNATCTTTGSIKVSPFGGSGAPYTVKLYNAAGTTLLATSTSIAAGGSYTFTNLTAATYTLKLSDKDNCAAPVSKTRTVTAPDAIATPAATVTQPTCATATATVTITPPVGSGITYTLKQSSVVKYTANASGVFSLVVAGTYQLNASNGTCNTNGSDVVVNAQPQTPAAPILSVINNCDGTSTITAKDAGNVNIPAGELTWSNGGNGNPISVTTTTAITATRTGNGCTSGNSNSVTPAPKTTPAAPILSVVNNCDGTSTITAKDAGNVNIPAGELTWSNAGNGNPITVTSTTAVTATRTGTGCTSGNSNSVSPAPKTTPAAPILSVVNNCDGTSTITAKDASDVNIPAGELSWSNGGNGNPITVTTTAAVTATRGSNGCSSGNSNSVSPAPRTTPAAPILSVVNNCDGTSTITAKDASDVNIPAGELTWSNSGSGNPITVTTTAAVTATRGSNGCSSGNSNLVSPAPRTTPGQPSVAYNAPACDEATFSVTLSSVISGASYSIFNKDGNAIAGVSPASPFVAPNNSNFLFSNIPAGSGYQVSVANSGCPSSANSCGNASKISSNKALRTEANSITDLVSQPSIKAYPNPFNNKVKFVVTLPQAGNGTLEVFNMMGQKIKTVYQGHVIAGANNFELNLAGQKNSNLVYKFIMGQKQITGKLLQIN
jgi:hypothetical protein